MRNDAAELASRAPDARTVAMSIAYGRAVTGVALLLAPRFLGRLFVGQLVHAPGGAFACRAFGAADLAFAVGAIRAERRGRPIRGWVEGAAMFDALDCAAALFGGRGLPALGRALYVFAGAFALAGAIAAQNLDEDEPTD
jgi:hypothetical protein